MRRIDPLNLRHPLIHLPPPRQHPHWPLQKRLHVRLRQDLRQRRPRPALHRLVDIRHILKKDRPRRQPRSHMPRPPRPLMRQINHRPRQQQHNNQRKNNSFHFEYPRFISLAAPLTKPKESPASTRPVALSTKSPRSGSSLKRASRPTP